MTSNSSRSSGSNPNRRPSGFPVANISVAAAALITATRGASPSSRGSKARPASSGISIVSKKPGATVIMCVA